MVLIIDVIDVECVFNYVNLVVFEVGSVLVFDEMW